MVLLPIRIMVVKAAPSRRSLRWKMSPQPMAPMSSRLSGAAMLTVTMVRKADYSGYRLYITPEMEGYPTDENQAAAYMNKIIEKEIMRAPEQYLWIHRRFKTRPVGESSLYI